MTVRHPEKTQFYRTELARTVNELQKVLGNQFWFELETKAGRKYLIQKLQ